MSFRDTNIAQWTLDTDLWVVSHGLEHLSTVASRWASNVLGNWWKGWLGWWWWPPYNTGLKMSNRPREREECIGSPLRAEGMCVGTLGAGDRAVRDALVSIRMVGGHWLAKLQKRATFNAGTWTAADHLSFHTDISAVDVPIQNCTSRQGCPTRSEPCEAVFAHWLLWTRTNP